jgi:hypothetical protein
MVLWHYGIHSLLLDGFMALWLYGPMTLWLMAYERQGKVEHVELLHEPESLHVEADGCLIERAISGLSFLFSPSPWHGTAIHTLSMARHCATSLHL